MKKMKKEFLDKIEKEIGQINYSGVLSDYWKAYGTKYCWFSEENESLEIHVDPEIRRKGAIELKP